MTDTDVREQLLLTTIANHPEDDRPRLEYARLLSRRDDPLGDFIVAQCELDRRAAAFPSTYMMHFPPGLRSNRLYPINKELYEWQRQLLQHHGEAWKRPLIEAGASEVHYRRGFPHELEIAAEAFPDRAATLLPLAPTARSLKLNRPDAVDQPIEDLRFCPLDVARAIANTSELARVQTLSLAGVESWGDAAVSEIIASRHLGNLRRLNLTGAATGPDAVHAALTSHRLANLEELTFGLNTEPMEVAGLIARLPQLPPRLRTIEIDGNDLHDEGAACLAAAPALAGLETLRLINCLVSANGINLLLDSEHLKNTAIEVTTLHLDQPTFDTAHRRLRQHNERCQTSRAPRRE